MCDIRVLSRYIRIEDGILTNKDSYVHILSVVVKQQSLNQSLSTYIEIVHTFNFYLKACTLRSLQHNTLKLHEG